MHVFFLSQSLHRHKRGWVSGPVGSGEVVSTLTSQRPHQLLPHNAKSSMEFPERVCFKRAELNDHRNAANPSQKPDLQTSFEVLEPLNQRNV